MDPTTKFIFAVKFIKRFCNDEDLIYQSFKGSHLLKWPFATSRGQLASWIWYQALSDAEKQRYMSILA